MWSPAFLQALFLFVLLWQDNEYLKPREKMVKQQIEQRGVKDPVVLNAMRTVKRHEFVPSAEVDDAYEDYPLPIGYGQTISQPYIVAFMTEAIKPQAGFKVLEIGTGSGYQAAVLSAIVKEVYTIEIVPELARTATDRLKRAGFKNVQVKSDDGYNGWKDQAPFDAIVVTAAAEYIPPPLIAQLKDGGRMVIPVGTPYMTQTLILVEKKRDATTTKNLLPVAFVPLTRRK